MTKLTITGTDVEDVQNQVNKIREALELLHSYGIDATTINSATTISTTSDIKSIDLSRIVETSKKTTPASVRISPRGPGLKIPRYVVPGEDGVSKESNVNTALVKTVCKRIKIEYEPRMVAMKTDFYNSTARTQQNIRWIQNRAAKLGFALSVHDAHDLSRVLSKNKARGVQPKWWEDSEMGVEREMVKTYYAEKHDVGEYRVYERVGEKKGRWVETFTTWDSAHLYATLATLLTSFLTPK
jgi:hypothetical protein